MKRILIILLLTCSAVALWAKLDWAAYPAGGYSNETGVEIGALSYIRNLPATADSLNRYDSLYFLAKYTTKNQFVFSLMPEIFLAQKRYAARAKLELERWPTNFYGIGINTDFDNYTRFTPVSYYLNFELSRKLSDYYSLSTLVDAKFYEVIKYDEGCCLAKYEELSLSSGWGMAITRDSRNGQYYPTAGSYLKLSSTLYDQYLGSDYDFYQIDLDARKYFSLNTKSVWNWQFVAGLGSGDVPFFKLHNLDDNMRGIPARLHQDKNMAVLRTEYKIFPWSGSFTQKLGFATFLEYGSVFADWENYQFSDNKINYGVGFRYTLFAGDRLNFRVDVGFGENGSEFTIMGTEAF
ncbi:MAG: BamA/TamA family outer membrane protein [Candidatus Cloacimonadales bacterium]